MEDEERWHVLFYMYVVFPWKSGGGGVGSQWRTFLKHVGVTVVDAAVNTLRHATRSGRRHTDRAEATPEKKIVCTSNSYIVGVIGMKEAVIDERSWERCLYCSGLVMSGNDKCFDVRVLLIA